MGKELRGYNVSVLCGELSGNYNTAHSPNLLLNEENRINLANTKSKI